MSVLLTKNRLIKQTLIYTLSDGLCKAISFITLPFISFYIVPKQLGICANFDVMMQVIMLLAGQVMIGVLPYVYYKKSKQELATWISSLFSVIIIICIAFLIIIIFCSDAIEKYLQIGLLLQLLTIVSVITHLITSIDTTLLRLEEKPFCFAFLQILQTIIYIVLLIVLVINLKLDAIGKIYSGVISFIVISILHLSYLLKRGYLVRRVDKKVIKEILLFALPLLPHSLSFWFKSGTDKILITNYCGLEANGLFSMAMSFGAIYTIFNTAFSNAFIPYLQKRINSFTDKNIEREKINLVFLTYKLSIGFVFLYFFLLIICWYAIYYLLSDKYEPSFQFMPYILLSLVFNSIYGLVIQYPYTIKKTVGIGLITFSGSIVQFALSYLLIKVYGMDGIKISIVIGSFIIMAGIWFYSNKVYPMPWITALKKLRI